jgi:hypothetical protein
MLKLDKVEMLLILEEENKMERILLLRAIFPTIYPPIYPPIFPIKII